MENKCLGPSNRKQHLFEDELIDVDKITFGIMDKNILCERDMDYFSDCQFQ